MKKTAASRGGTEIVAVENWSVPLTRAGGHIIPEWQFQNKFFSRQELYKLHKQLVRCYAENVYICSDDRSDQII